MASYIHDTCMHGGLRLRVYVCGNKNVLMGTLPPPPSDAPVTPTAMLNVYSHTARLCIPPAAAALPSLSLTLRQ